MKIKYNIEINKEAIKVNLSRLTNQIYKLLPTWEEGLDWNKPLSTIIIEIAGMNELFLDHQDIFFSLLCKLEGLFTFKDFKKDFFLFRKTIFEILSLVNKLNENVE
jgi:hypothetical protein